MYEVRHFTTETFIADVIAHSKLNWTLHEYFTILFSKQFHSRNKRCDSLFAIFRSYCKQLVITVKILQFLARFIWCLATTRFDRTELQRAKESRKINKFLRKSVYLRTNNNGRWHKKGRAYVISRTRFVGIDEQWTEGKVDRANSTEGCFFLSCEPL